MEISFIVPHSKLMDNVTWEMYMFMFYYRPRPFIDNYISFFISNF